MRASVLVWSCGLLPSGAAALKRRPGLLQRQFEETTSACEKHCQLGGPDVKIYAWATPDHPFVSTIGVLRLTSTIVTIINTVDDTTSISTEYPPEYNSVPTNGDGTQVQTISYTRSGEMLVTTVPFPTIFVAWPDWYVWSGSMPVTGSDNATTCVTNDGDTTTFLTEFPQPTEGRAREQMEASVAFHPITSDPGGLQFRPVSDTYFSWEFSALSTLFPKQPAVTGCTLIDGESGPNWAGFTDTRWMDPVTTTRYIGAQGGGQQASTLASEVKEDGPTPTTPTVHTTRPDHTRAGGGDTSPPPQESTRGPGATPPPNPNPTRYQSPVPSSSSPTKNPPPPPPPPSLNNNTPLSATQIVQTQPSQGTPTLTITLPLTPAPIPPPTPNSNPAAANSPATTQATLTLAGTILTVNIPVPNPTAFVTGPGGVVASVRGGPAVVVTATMSGMLVEVVVVVGEGGQTAGSAGGQTRAPGQGGEGQGGGEGPGGGRGASHSGVRTSAVGGTASASATGVGGGNRGAVPAGARRKGVGAELLGVLGVLWVWLWL